jgi:anti-sigma factor RsiW
MDEMRSHLGLAAESGSSLKLRTRREGHQFSWRLLATAAVLMLGISIAGIIVWQNHNASVDALSRELVSAHVRSTQADHLLDVVSTDQHTVKPWFSGKLDFSPPVRDLAAAGFALEGGRLDYIAGRPVAALIYRHNKHVINCFVWPGDRTESPASATAFQGYALVQFNQNGLTWHLVSDASRETLEQLARELQTPIN